MTYSHIPKTAEITIKPSLHFRELQKSAKTGKITAKIDLFGTHAVTEAWLNPQRHIHALYVTDKALDGFDEALKKAHDRGLKRPAPQVVDKAMLDQSPLARAVSIRASPSIVRHWKKPTFMILFAPMTEKKEVF